jgi:hypothetical protein
LAKLNKKELDTARNALKAEAKRRIAERGLLQFRADAETVREVIDKASELNMPVGALLRLWIQERLMIESGREKSPDLIGRVSILEDAVNKLQQQLNE